jgi:dCTP deaminase
MILSNVELFRALDEGRLVIEPQPFPRTPSIDNPDCPFDTHSIDLRLGNQISVPESGQLAYDLTQPGSIADTISRHSSRQTITRERPYVLPPQHFVLGTTLEKVSLPILPDRDVCLAARIEGKSSRARFGLLVHFTAPTVHPGFEGNLTLEMINLGPANFVLVPGMHIAQLIVEEVRGIPNRRTSAFQGQSTPAGH